MRPGLLALLVPWTLVACAQRAPVTTVPAPPTPQAVTAQDIQQELQPDRPDLANGTHVVPVGLAQLETGGEWAHVKTANDEAGIPLSLRLGLREWIEARVETLVDVYESAPGQRRGVSGLSAGGKISFSQAFAIIPAVQLPVGTEDGTSYLLTLITGTDFHDVNHVDANYGVASIFANPGHFFQQWLVVSLNRQVTDRFNPYVETYWFSRQASGGARVVSTDFGFVYTLDERMAFDCGADIGLTSNARRSRFFGGMTVILGETFGHKGVHARLREAAERHVGRSR